MKQAILRPLDDQTVAFSHAGGSAEIPLSARLLQEWGAEYAAAVKLQSPKLTPQRLLALGRSMTETLNARRALEPWLQESGARRLEIRSDRHDAARLFDAPWELLAAPGPAGDFLAAERVDLFLPARRLGAPPDPPAKPAGLPGDLSLLFMAASPEGKSVLDFEAEESAIFEATRNLDRLRLTVEESGSLSGLQRALLGGGPFQALHVSCHGDFDPEGRAVLFLETAEGERHIVTPEDLIPELGPVDARLPFLFLSACRTAEEGRSGDPMSAHFVRRAIAAGFGAALGWGASVLDREAGDFARFFYQRLSVGRDLDEAAAWGRHELLKAHRNDPRSGQDWHMARLYLHAAGGGPLCDPRNPRAPVLFTLARHEDFADFVGRRREMQRLLRVFRRPRRESRGAILHGLGSIGKSSLALRLARRLQDAGEMRLVAPRRLDANAIFEAMLGALGERRRQKVRRYWEQAGVEQNLEGALGEILKILRSGAPEAPDDPEENKRPVLLLLDGLEQILEPPQIHDGRIRQRIKNAPVAAEAFRLALGAVLRAFQRDDSGSGLLVASRYDFEAPNPRSGEDDAEWLERVSLPSMAWASQQKQERRVKGGLAASPRDPARRDRLEALAKRAAAASCGNPGVMRTLARPVVEGREEEAERLLAEVESWIRGGGAAEDAAQDGGVLHALSLDLYRRALSEDQRKILHGASLFREGLSVPWSTLEESWKPLGLEAAAARTALERLVALGLVEVGESGRPRARHGAVSPLVRPLAGFSPTAEQRAGAARSAFDNLRRSWDLKDEDPLHGDRGVQLAELAVAAGDQLDAETALKAATRGGEIWLRDRDRAKEAWAILEPAMAQALSAGAALPPAFVLLAADCAERLGEIGTQGDLLDNLAQDLEALSPQDRKIARFKIGYRAWMTGEVAAALEHFSQLPESRDEAGGRATRSGAFGGRLAEAIRRADEWESTLAIRRAEVERVSGAEGPEQEKVLKKALDALQQRSEWGEALSRRQEEMSPVFEMMPPGDREEARLLSQIADVLELGGEWSEALRVRREEMLPLFEELGDPRAKALALRHLAEVLAARGDGDEALRLYREEVLPVFEKGGAREKARILNKIADVLQARGDFDEALRIYREETSPIFERLGDLRAQAETRNKIADALRERGELEEALRIHREEALPVFQSLGDPRGEAVTQQKIAETLAKRGDLQEALRIYREEALPVFTQLRDIRLRGAVLIKIADLLEAIGGAEAEVAKIRAEVLTLYTTRYLAISRPGELDPRGGWVLG